jgi:hypothetical protein
LPAVAVVAATALSAAATVAATALPAAAAVAAMALPAATAFVVFATLTLIMELPAAFKPLTAAASTTQAPPAMLPSTLTSVRSLLAWWTTAFVAVLPLRFFDPMFYCCEDIMRDLRRVLVVWKLHLRFAKFLK